MCARKQEGLLARHPFQRNEHVGNIFESVVLDLVGALQLAGAGKGFQKRSDVIAKFAVADSGLLQNVAGKHVEIKLRRNAQVRRVGQDRFDQLRMIEHRIARFGITQKIDQ